MGTNLTPINFVSSLKISTYILIFSVLVLNATDALADEGEKSGKSRVPKTMTELHAMQASIAEFLPNVPSIEALKKEMRRMPRNMKIASLLYLTDLKENYDELSQHQKDLLQNSGIFTGKIMTSYYRKEQFRRVHYLFKEQFKYLRDVKGHTSGFAFIVNAAPGSHGGQKAYLVDMRTGVLMEVVCSTSWKGFGYKEDSDQTPLGYFKVTAEKEDAWGSMTMQGDVTDLYRKIKKQVWRDTVKWLHRVSTKKERAYITSNQFALKGQNYGDEYVPLSAPKFYFNNDTVINYVNNQNSSKRQIYIHGTNRLEQLGYALSGGCVRVTNTFSYLFGSIFAIQEEIPVIVDAVKFKNSLYNIPQFPSPDTFEQHEMDLEVYHISVEPYKTIAQHNFVEDRSLHKLKADIDVRIIAPLLESIKHNFDFEATVTIGSTVPFPERAMKDWLKYHNDLDGYKKKAYFHNFDMDANHYTSVDGFDSALYIPFTTTVAKDIVQKRIDFTKEYIQSKLKQTLEELELNFYDVENVKFEVEQPEFEGSSGHKLPLGYGISYLRRRVLDHYLHLDSLARVAPDTFKISELQWIESYIEKPKQIFVRKFGDLELEDVVTYEDALLSQAYIYALGEMNLRELMLKKRRIPELNSPEFFNIFEEEEFYRRLDLAGINVLLSHTQHDTKLDHKFLIGRVKKGNQRILGIIQTSEEVLSKFKPESNQLVVHKQLKNHAEFTISQAVADNE